MNVSEDKENQDIEFLVEKAKTLGLEKPLDFIVESHFPLSNLIYHLSLLMEPMMKPFFSISRIRNISSMLSDENKRNEFLTKLRSE